MRVPVQDQCRFCKCTEGDACRLESGETCWWMTKDKNLCSNPKCILAADVERKADRLARRQQTERFVKPIRESFQQAIVRRREEAEKKRRRKTKGCAA